MLFLYPTNLTKKITWVAKLKESQKIACVCNKKCPIQKTPPPRCPTQRTLTL